MSIKKNVGYADSVIRTLIGAIIVIIGIYYQTYWGFLGLIFVITGAVSYCPVYRLLKISTIPFDLEREN